MLRQSKRILWLLSIAAPVALAIGCASKQGDGQSRSAGLFPPPPDKGGSQLWAENCSRCHNVRPPQQYSDAQWAMIVHHMRLRADLTGEEQRKITAFLQASN